MTETQGKTILIVEDEQDAAEMFAEMIRMSGYRVQKAYGSAAAMTLLEKEIPAAVVLDIMMPDVSGLEVLGYVRREPALLQIPVIIVSAKGTPADIRAGLAAGAAVYLTKPVTYPDLKKALEKVLAG